MKTLMMLPFFLLSFLSVQGQSGIVYLDKPNQDTMPYLPVKYELTGPDAVAADSVIVKVPGDSPKNVKKGTIYPGKLGWMPVRYQLYQNNILISDKTDSVLIAGPAGINATRIGSLSQCHAGNEFCLTARPVDAFGNPVTYLWVGCGDGSERYTDSNFNDTFCCSYTGSGNFTRLIRVHDKYGGKTDTLLTNNVVKTPYGIGALYHGDGYSPFDPDKDLALNGDTQNVQEWHLFIDGIEIPKHSGIFDTLIDIPGCHIYSTHTIYKDGCEGYSTDTKCLDSVPDSKDAWITYPYNINQDTFGRELISYELTGPAASAADSFVVVPYAKLPRFGKINYFQPDNYGWLHVDYRLYKKSILIATGTDSLYVVVPPVVNGFRVNSDTQCFSNNSFCVAANPVDVYGNDVATIAVACGDHTNNIITLTNPTDTCCCQYEFPGTYFQRIIVTDKYGAETDSVIRRSVVTKTSGRHLLYNGNHYGPLNPDTDLKVWGDTQDVIEWHIFIDSVEIPHEGGVFDTLINLSGCHTLTTYTIYMSGCEARKSGSFCLQSPLSMNEPKQQFQIYPNPASSYIFIESETKLDAGTWQLVNAQGQIWPADIVPSGDLIYRMSVAELPAGVYLLHYLDNESRRTVKFIKY